MKNRNLFYMGISLLLAFAFVSCIFIKDPIPDPTLIVFQLNDTTVLHKVAVVPTNNTDSNKYSIPTYPKLDRNAPFFTETNLSTHWGFTGSYYDKCELATEPKYIALKDGYYMAYPYVELCGLTTFLDVDWSDLCNVDLDTVPVMHFEENVFKNVCNIEEATVANLTKKSTIHHSKRNKEQVTIDDVVDLLNKLIEEDRLEDYNGGLFFFAK